MDRFNFTKRAINDLAIPEIGRKEYADTKISGLRVRVAASGRKVFCVIRKKNGKFIRSTIGTWPDLTVDGARRVAMNVLRDIATTGNNPNETRRIHQKASVTLLEALEEYISSRGERIKTTTAEQYRAALGNYSQGWMGQPLRNISRERVQQQHQAISEGRISWINKDGQAVKMRNASKAQADLWGRSLRAVYRFAHDHYRDEDGTTLLPDPPTLVLSTKRQWNHVSRKTSRIRNHDLGRWLAAVEQVRSEATANRQDTTAAICDGLDLALFTGLRRSEVFGLTWERVNLGGRFFWIEETKNGDPLELPITNTLLTIFRRRWNVCGMVSVYVFPSASNIKPIQEPRKTIKRIVAQTVPSPNSDGLTPIAFTCHDARRTFGSVAELAGVGTYILKRLMNHKSKRDDITEGYLSFSADELRGPAERIERAMLEHAGLAQKPDAAIDSQLAALVEGMPEKDKRRLLFELAAKLHGNDDTSASNDTEQG
ncbi:integrase family protein [Oceanisphaera sp. DM8]|uniref:Integrase family protein n=1 Tax=Oceanisphaera pacifica TaxID=2818389 RepID=A0ABS3NCC0_9GAMM|nr:integrase family protein [Oceanisphaera pacifica]